MTKFAPGLMCFILRIAGFLACFSIAQQVLASGTGYFYVSLFGDFFPIPDRYFIVVRDFPNEAPEQLELNSPIVRYYPGMSDPELINIMSAPKGRIRIGRFGEGQTASSLGGRLEILSTYESGGLSVMEFDATFEDGDVVSEDIYATLIYDKRSYIMIVDEDPNLASELLELFVASSRR